MKKIYMMMSIYTISKILNFNYPLSPLVTEKKILLMHFFVMPEDIRVEKGFTAKQAHQPHS